MIWSALTILIVTLPGFFLTWKDLQVLYWVFIVCAPITYAGFAYEICMTWRIKQLFEKSGVQTFDELSQHAHIINNSSPESS